MNSIEFILAIVAIVSVDVFPHSYLGYIALFLLFLFRINTVTIGNLSGQLKAFGLIILFSLVKISQLTTESCRDIGLIFLGIACFFNRKELYIKKIKLFNIILILCFVYCFITTQTSFEISIQSFLGSSMGFESSMLSFVFPFFFYYWLGKNRRMAILNCIVVMLCGKRISIGAIIIIYLYYIFLNNRKIGKIIANTNVILGVNAVYLVLSFCFLEGDFDSIISEWTGLSANAVTMGRQELYASVFSNQSHSLDMAFLYGIGVGNIKSFMGGGELLHNDVLRIVVENGIPMSILFFVLFYKGLDDVSKGFMILWNLLFLTDNTFIYPPVIFTVFLLLQNHKKYSQ